ncbi:MAG: serine/threonine protein kinase, partial [Deltaproteobacteria bacterium]|nr:serine/threonine protein kinase [Deltaproteobacteria bacterium]
MALTPTLKKGCRSPRALADDLVVCRSCGLEQPSSAFGERCPRDSLALVPHSELQANPQDSLLGAVLAGKYLVVGVLGAGGMGTVYRAVQEPVGREVALKTIRPMTASRSELEGLGARFHREAKVMARLSHPSTVRLYDYGIEKNLLFMVLELVRGRTLAQAISQDGFFAPRRAMGVARQVLGALAEAHSLGLVHRDIKPANIMVFRGLWDEEWVKILDFGLAKAFRADASLAATTQTQGAIGTPLYMAPEQGAEQPADARSDLYSFGVVLYELLAGRPPFMATTPVGAIVAHREQAVPPMPAERSIPPELERAVLKALAKRPENRFANAREMAEALLKAIPHEPSLLGLEAAKAGDLVPMPALQRRTRAWPVAAALIAGGALGALAVRWATPPSVAVPEIVAGWPAQSDLSEVRANAAPGLQEAGPSSGASDDALEPKPRESP